MCGPPSASGTGQHYGNWFSRRFFKNIQSLEGKDSVSDVPKGLQLQPDYRGLQAISCSLLIPEKRILYEREKHLDGHSLKSFTTPRGRLL